jgi:hypothetical protein
MRSSPFVFHFAFYIIKFFIPLHGIVRGSCESVRRGGVIAKLLTAWPDAERKCCVASILLYFQSARLLLPPMRVHVNET